MAEFSTWHSCSALASDACDLLCSRYLWSWACGAARQRTVPSCPFAWCWCVFGRVSALTVSFVGDNIQSSDPFSRICCLFFHLFTPYSMILLNYLGRKGTESGMVAGLTISVPWDAHKSAASMEEPLNWLLFNKFLTYSLCRAMIRSELKVSHTEKLCAEIDPYTAQCWTCKQFQLQCWTHYKLKVSVLSCPAFLLCGRPALLGELKKSVCL